jgi:anti-sigma-K factor RskA
MRGESDRLSRAGSFVLGLMSEADRQRAERDLVVDPAFREAVLKFAERLQVLDVVPHKELGGAEQWRLVATQIGEMPQMRRVVEDGTAPAGKVWAVGRGLLSRRSRQAVYAASLIAAFAAGYLVALWLM